VEIRSQAVWSAATLSDGLVGGEGEGYFAQALGRDCVSRVAGQTYLHRMFPDEFRLGLSAFIRVHQR